MCSPVLFSPAGKKSPVKKKKGEKVKRFGWAGEMSWELGLGKSEGRWAAGEEGKEIWAQDQGVFSAF